MSQLYIKMEGNFQTNEAIDALLSLIGDQIRTTDAIRGTVDSEEHDAFADWSAEAG